MTSETKPSFHELITSWGIRKQRILHLCNVSDRFRICYVETPKVACSTIKKTLQTAEIHPKPWNFYTSNMDRSESPLRCIDEDNFVSVLYGKEYFRFSFVRDPLSRVLSAYMEKIRNPYTTAYYKRYAELGLGVSGNVSFLKFLRCIAELPPHDLDIHWCPQHLLLNFDEIEYDHIGRFERFTEDFKVVQSIIYERSGIEVDIQNQVWHKVNAQSKIKHFLTKEVADIVSDVYSADYDYFGYSRPDGAAVSET